MSSAIDPGADHPSRRPCYHMRRIHHPVTPRSTSCRECLERDANWISLWLCLSCGWVACSNDSPNQHAKAHYEETDHPIAVPLQSDLRQRWCFVHQRAV